MSAHTPPHAGRLPSPEELLAALDPDQRQVAEHLQGPMCVLAGAGTGKTRAITYRIAYGVATGAYEPTQVLAVTFTRRAAGEMRSRLADLGVPGVQARTFHSAALRQLRYFYPVVVGGEMPQVRESKAALVATAIRHLRLTQDRALTSDLAAEIEWAKVSLIRPEQYIERATAAGRQSPGGLELETVAKAYDLYEELKTEAHVLDFEDVLLAMTGFLRSREDVAARIQGQYKHFVVDEYQDVSPLQHRLLRLWLGERRSQICVVGDVSQTIYSFAGATPTYLQGFAREFPSARTVVLNRDYRSTPQIVGLANRVLSTTKRRVTLPPGAVELVAQQPSGPAVSYHDYADDMAEADGLAEQVVKLQQQGVALKDIAILFRVGSQSQAIENALAHAGIGYVVRGGTSFFEREEIKNARRQLSAAVATGARGELTGDLGEDVRHILDRLGWQSEAPAPRGAVRERWDALNALVTLADDLAETRHLDLRGYVAELNERAEAQSAPTVDGVTLMTIHASKGLEWEAVLITGVTDGLLPISRAEGKDAIEEEKRLLYVGVTRARQYLSLNYARARNAGGRASRKPSRFLDGLWPEPEETRQARLPSSRKAKAREDADTFEQKADAQSLELFEALRDWRKQAAQEKSVPAYTVFPDATLRLIALMKPQSSQELIAVHGVGPTKLQTYGSAVIQIVRDVVG